MIQVAQEKKIAHLMRMGNLLCFKPIQNVAFNDVIKFLPAAAMPDE